jgi:hypothetical protein
MPGSPSNFLLLAATLTLASPASLTLLAATFDVTRFGAVPDGSTDSAPAIQRALDAAAAEGGGTVLLPPAPLPYLLRDGLRITSSNIRLAGQGAKLQVAGGAFNGAPRPAIHILGSVDRPIAAVHLSGFSLDANYYSLRDSKDSKGIVVQLAQDVTVEDVSVTRAYVGVSVRRCQRVQVRRVTVTDYAEDAFDAGGDGDTVDNGKSFDILFDEVVARDAPRAAADGNGFEIEDGATRVRVLNSLVENVAGNGAGLRNHLKGEGQNHTSSIEFRNVIFRNTRGAYAIFCAAPPPSIQDRNSYSHVRLINLQAEAPSAFWGPINGLSIEGGTYNLILLGLQQSDGQPSTDNALRSAKLSSVRFEKLLIAPAQGPIELVR